MARTRVRWGRVGALLAGAGIAMTLAASAAHAGSPADGRGRSAPAAGRAPATRTWVVRPGDTLWAIARRIAGPGVDLRPVVDELAAANGVEGPLAVGMHLALPG